MIKTVLTAAALGLAMVSAPVLASSDGVRTISVKSNDLNLGSLEGQKRLNRRIETAARKVCGLDKQRPATRIRSYKSQRCYETALKNVEEQVAARIEEQQRGG